MIVALFKKIKFKLTAVKEVTAPLYCTTNKNVIKGPNAEILKT